MIQQIVLVFLAFSLMVGVVTLIETAKMIDEGDKRGIPVFIAVLVFVIGMLLMIEEMVVL